MGHRDGPRNPLLLLVADDDEQAVSRLPASYSRDWEIRTAEGSTATARVAADLGVPTLVTRTAELPTGHDLLLLGGVGRGMTTAAAVVACTRLGAEPQLATGFGSGISDTDWMAKVADVRGRTSATDTGPPACIEILAEVLTQAGQQGVPVLLDGVVATAAASVCPDQVDAHLPVRGDEPAQKWFTDHVDVPVWDVHGLPPGEGLGALSGLAWLRLGLLAADV